MNLWSLGRQLIADQSTRGMLNDVVQTFGLQDANQPTAAGNSCFEARLDLQVLLPSSHFVEEGSFIDTIMLRGQRIA